MGTGGGGGVGVGVDAVVVFSVVVSVFSVVSVTIGKVLVECTWQMIDRSIAPLPPLDGCDG